MTKEEILFLLNAGFTVSEIQAMKEAPQPATQAAPQPDPQPATQAAPQPDPQPATQAAPQPDPQPAPAAPTLEQQLTDLKNEIASLRGSVQDRNRLSNVIEIPQKKTTFEEDIEAMIEEVTK